MKTFQEKIDRLRNELLESIKTIMRNNDLTELDIDDVYNSTNVIWWSAPDHIDQSRIIAVQLTSNKLSVVVDTGKFGEGPELILDETSFALQHLSWLEELRSTIILALENIYERICHECGKPMNSGYCVANGEEYYCSDECLHKHYTEEEWAAACNNTNSDSYWTEWEEKE